MPVTSRIFIVFLSLAATGLDILATLRLDGQKYAAAGIVMAIAIPICALGLIYLSVTLPGYIVNRLALELGLLLLLVPTVEIGLTAFAWTSPSIAEIRRFRTADRLGVPFDHRFKSQVVDDLRARGLRAYPSIPRDMLVGANVKERVGFSLYPLSEVANSIIVECNETGQFLTYESDELGFNNPHGLFSSGKIDVAVIGSSYTVGQCVPADRGYVDLLRHRYPRTLNFGIAGSHAPTMLATLLEYVQGLRPALVIWEMHSGSFELYELNDPTINRYLDNFRYRNTSYSQHLLERRTEVDEFLRDVVTPLQWERDQVLADDIAIAHRQRWRQLAHLPLLREKLNQALAGIIFRPQSFYKYDWDGTVAIIKIVKELVESWGGHLVVVLIPTIEVAVPNQFAAAEDKANAYVLNLLKSTQVHIINGIPYFRGQPDPAALFGWGMQNHFSEEGHRLFAELIDADLRVTYPELMTAARR
jgi:hypothetical protein